MAKVVFSRSSSEFPENNEKFDGGGRSTLTVETEGGGRASLKVEAEGGGRASSKVEAEDGGGASLKVEADNGGSASLKDPDSNNWVMKATQAWRWSDEVTCTAYTARGIRSKIVV